MSSKPPRDFVDESARLHICVRDLAALNALPSMCIGRSPEEAIDVVMEALPTLLACDVVYLALPGTPLVERFAVREESTRDALLEFIHALASDEAANDHGELTLGAARLSYMVADVPMGDQRGRLFVARKSTFAADTDRVLVRTAANVVGTTLQSAHVLDNARRKDEFLAMLGHELRNPLAPILTAVELLARNATAAREQAVIYRHTRYLARLVDDLLDISRVTHGHIELRSELVSLAGAIDRAVEIVMPLVTRQKHVLTIADASPIMLRGDSVRLAQVFGNLLTNAAKFTAAGGKIDIAVTRLDGRVRVSVRDNGRGISREDARRIFEPFAQGDAQRDSLIGGLGLGLAIVNKLVTLHGGTIAVESDGPGHGSTFHVELPTVAAIEQVAPARIAQPHVARAGIRVLVVDDNVDIADLVAEALRDQGFETTVAHEAHEALAMWRTFSPHAAVLDVGLPDMDGYELARTLRKEHGSAPMLIAATGCGQKRDRSRATEAGFDCHFVKPVSVHDLVGVLDARVVGQS